MPIKIFLLCLVILINGCAVVKPPADAIKESVDSHKINHARDIKAFTISGKMAARDNKEGFSASFYWTQSSPNQFSVNLFGPMGAGNTLIKSNGKVLTIKTKDGIQKTQSNQLNAIMRQQIGYLIPINDLYFWLRGLTHNQNSISNEAIDNNWSIRVTGSQKVNNIILPQRLKLRFDNLSIKLKINTWVIR